MKKGMKAAIILLSAAVMIGIAFFTGTLVENERLNSINYAEYALKKMNLPKQYAPAFCLHGYTGFRDSFLMTTFQIQYSIDREDLLERMTNTEGWIVSPVTEAELRGFSKCFWYPDLLTIPDNTVFDAWFYRETSQPILGAETAKDCFSSIGKIGRGFEFAVFDLETGIIVFVNQFG